VIDFDNQGTLIDAVLDQPAPPLSICLPICGDGFLIDPETCDDGDMDNLDGCNYDCQIEPGWNTTTDPFTEICGDEFIVGTEECDPGFTGTYVAEACNDDCTLDLGWNCTNVTTSQGYISAFSCQPVCNDTYIRGFEDCEDGNDDRHDGCDDLCRFEPGWNRDEDIWVPVCGDGYVTGDEECDPLITGAYMNETCDPVTCTLDTDGWNCTEQ